MVTIFSFDPMTGENLESPEYFQNRSGVIWATLGPFMTFKIQNTAAFNLTFIRRSTRVFAFVSHPRRDIVNNLGF